MVYRNCDMISVLRTTRNHMEESDPFSTLYKHAQTFT